LPGRYCRLCGDSFRSVTTTELLARAMMYVAQNGYAKRILESRDINEAAAATRSS
jgi:hypothetical protein